MGMNVYLNFPNDVLSRLRKLFRTLKKWQQAVMSQKCMSSSEDLEQSRSPVWHEVSEACFITVGVDLILFRLNVVK